MHFDNSNLTIHRKLSRKFQGRHKRNFPVSTAILYDALLCHNKLFIERAIYTESFICHYNFEYHSTFRNIHFKIANIQTKKLYAEKS